MGSKRTAKVVGGVVLRKHKYTDEQREFIKNNIKGRSNNELTKLFNEKFGTNLKPSQLKSYRGNYGLVSGYDARFKKGQEPWNKGLIGVVTGGTQTQFKKGDLPSNTLEIGTEILRGDGYIYVKIDNPNVWKQKHHIIWEEHNGPIPAEHVVLFGDGDKTNFNIDNLILISRVQLLTLNRYNLIQSDADLTRTGIIIADIQHKISDRRKR